MYGYHMEGKVLFIWKSLSPVNHSWAGLDWWCLTSAQCADTNAIIPLLVPSLSVNPNPVWQNETDTGGASKIMTTAALKMSKYLSFPLFLCSEFTLLVRVKVIFSVQLVTHWQRNLIILWPSLASHYSSSLLNPSLLSVAPLGAACNGTLWHLSHCKSLMATAFKVHNKLNSSPKMVFPLTCRTI